MSHLVKAIFKGKNLSCGYETNKEYTLSIDQASPVKYITIAREDASDENELSKSRVGYSSIKTFLDNWDNIRKI